MVCSSVEAISIRLLVREKLEKSRFFQVLRGCGRHAHNLDNVPLKIRNAVVSDSHAGTMNNGSTHEIADTRQKRRATGNCTVANTSPSKAARIEQIENLEIYSLQRSSQTRLIAVD